MAYPAWYNEMLRLKGLKEAPGAANNPIILGWAKRLGGWIASFYKSDATPWCGLFCAHAFAIGLPNEPRPANPLGALEWRKFGVPMNEPAIGAVLVFTRKGGGHVGLYAGEDETRYYVLAGNQDDMVKVSPILKERCVAVRWPKTIPVPKNGRVRVAAAGKLSSNEA
jgi:uncharacterized protein (TIGR02594 family)